MTTLRASQPIAAGQAPFAFAAGCAAAVAAALVFAPLGCTSTDEPPANNDDCQPPIPTSSIVTGEPQAAEGGEVVRVRAEAADLDTAEFAVRERAAMAVMGEIVEEAAIDDPQWAATVNRVTMFQPGEVQRTRITCGQIVEAVVLVYTNELMGWANSEGYLPAGLGDGPTAPGIPEPDIVVIPTTQMGEWPQQLSSNERLVQSVFVETLTADPYNLAVRDYDTVVRGLGAIERETSTSSLNAEYIVAADIYIGYDLDLTTNPTTNTSRAVVTVSAVIVTTGDVVFDERVVSDAVARGQEQQAISQAAQGAAQNAVRETIAHYQDEYERGVPYQVRATNVYDPTDALTLRLALGGLSAERDRDGRGVLHSWNFDDGVASCWMRGDATQHGDPSAFMAAIEQALEREGYRARGQAVNRRFITFELVPQ